VSLHFLFVQFEFTHAVGPHAGRYVVEPTLLGASSSAGDGSPDQALDARNQEVAGVARGIGDSDVLVIGVRGAPARRTRVLRRARQIEPDAAPADVPLAIVTFVRGTLPLNDRGEAGRRLDEIRFSDERQDQWVTAGLRALNLAIRAYRAGAPDPYAIEVTRRDARRVRVGYGTTEQVQDGLWREALELPPPAGRRPKRIERLRPAEAVASVLAGRATVLESEDVLARALIDLDNRRTRAAAFQVGAAIRLLGAEAESEPAGGVLDLASLEQHAKRAGELEATAARRALDDAEAAELESIIDGVDALLDARRYASAGER
jgi:hypothetical protein